MFSIIFGMALLIVVVIVLSICFHMSSVNNFVGDSFIGLNSVHGLFAVFLSAVGV